MKPLTRSRYLFKNCPVGVYLESYGRSIDRINRYAHVDSGPYIPTESPFKHQSWFSKAKTYIGFGDNNVFALRRSTIFQYEACTDKLNPAIFFKQLELPDTLYSFFLLVQLHCWLCQVRSMREGPEGRILRNELTERMWQDFDVRLERIEVFSSSTRKSILSDLLYQQQGAMLSYDEGLLTDDKTLAGAIWRTLYSKDLVDPRHLYTIVKYVRFQLEHLNSIGSRHWCLDGKFDWAPFPPLQPQPQKSLPKEPNKSTEHNSPLRSP